MRGSEELDYTRHKQKRVTTEAYMRKDVQGNPEWYNIFAIEPNDMTYYRSVIRNK